MVNKAYSTEVAHEYGHGLNVWYGTGNGANGIGEAVADVWAMFVFETPCVFACAGGEPCNDFCIRSGLSTVRYCGDEHPSCYEDLHQTGQALMGALWKVRRNLVNSLGPSEGALTTDLLFLDWLNG